MAVAFLAAGTETNLAVSTSSSVAVDMPTGVSSGDLLVVLWNQDANTYPTAPGGWSTLGTADPGASNGSGTDRPHTAVYYKISDGTEGASQTWTVSTAAYPTGDADIKAICFAFTGADTTTPIDAGEWSSTTTTATSSSRDSPSVTPSLDESALLIWRGVGSVERSFTSSVTSASPAGVERWDGADTPNGTIDTCAYTREGSFSGAQTFTMVASSTVSDGSAEWSIIIRPASTATNVDAEHVSATGTANSPIAGEGASAGSSSPVTANTPLAGVGVMAEGLY